MGVCCSSNSILRNDDSIRTIIRNLYIRNLYYEDLKKILISFSTKIPQQKTELIKENFAKVFYLKDPINNPHILYQAIIFEEFYNLLKPDLNIYEILLFAYPLLKKKKNQKSFEEFVEILVNVYGEFNSVNRLKDILMKIFEFYSYKITKLIKLETNNNELNENSFKLIKYVYNYDNINKAIFKILKKLLETKNNLDEFNVTSEEICDILKDKKIFNFEEIRDSIIQEIS